MTALNLSDMSDKFEKEEIMRDLEKAVSKEIDICDLYNKKYIKEVIV